MFRSPTSFEKGAKVHVAEAFDCANCEVTLSQPIPDNENIIDLYDSLPQKYDAFSGVKDMSAEGIKFVFQVYGIHPDLWEDYYNRLMFFHRAFLEAKDKREKRKQKKQEMVEKAKKGRTSEPEPGKAGAKVRI
jgi:hypothetical protein